MASSRLFLLALILPLLLLLLPTPISADAPSPSSSSNGTTIYDLLPEYGLPPGLLPDTVKSFSVASNGRFVADLYGSCYVDFEYVVYYTPRVSGYLSYGGIANLEGIQIRSYLIWYDLNAVMVDLPSSDFIYFQFGWFTRKLRIDQFMNVHSCRASLTLFERAKAVARYVFESIFSPQL